MRLANTTPVRKRLAKTRLVIDALFAELPLK
jgi:hypothetical protein